MKSLKMFSLELAFSLTHELCDMEFIWIVAAYSFANDVEPTSYLISPHFLSCITLLLIVMTDTVEPVVTADWGLKRGSLFVTRLQGNTHKIVRR